MFVFIFSSGSVSRTLWITFWFSSVFSEAPGSWVYVSYVRLSKDPSYGAASGTIYIRNLMGQVPVFTSRNTWIDFGLLETGWKVGQASFSVRIHWMQEEPVGRTSVSSSTHQARLPKHSRHGPEGRGGLGSCGIKMLSL